MPARPARLATLARRSCGRASPADAVSPGAPSPPAAQPQQQHYPLQQQLPQQQAGPSCAQGPAAAAAPPGVPAPAHRVASGWHQPLRPCRPSSRHQRSASLGFLGPAPASGIGAWWTGPLPPGALAAAPHAAPSPAGSLLGLGAWGGALGSFVAESLGARRPSFCLDPAALARQASSRAPSRPASSAGCLLPTCLICLDTLSPEEFESGEAIVQACSCKGDAALRHLRCALQWSRVKRSTVCDVCRTRIGNLPELPPDGPSPGGGGSGEPGGSGDAWDPLALGDPPGPADYALDAVRLTWMTLLVAALFFDLPLGRAAALGALVGVGLTAAAHALAMAARSAAAVRAFAAALRERAVLAGQQQQQQQLQLQQLQMARSWGPGSGPLPQPPVGEPAAAAGAGARPGGGDAPGPSHARTASSTVLLITEEDEPPARP
jgi:hypothetical protein